MLQDGANSFRIVVQGPPLPSDVFIASSNLESGLVEILRQRMLAHEPSLIEAIARHQSKYVGSALVPAQDDDYEPIRDVYQAIGQGEFVQ